MTTLPEPAAAGAPSLLRSLLFVCATVTLLALSLGALYVESEEPSPSSLATSR